MRKTVYMILIGLIMVFNFTFAALSADETEMPVAEETVNAQETAAPAPIEEMPEKSGLENFARSIFGSGMVDLFVKGGFTMWPILALLIWAVATIIWKLIALSFAKINTNALLSQILPLLEQKKYKEAVDILSETRGPIASVLKLGILKADKGIVAVEKAVETAGVLEMAFLEKGFNSLSTTINLAPMFGFFGTLVGMIQAFDDIAKAGEVDPTIVADGIKVALITSAAGLAVAIPVQFFNNLFLGFVDGMVIEMQKAAEAVVETIVESNQGE